MLNNYLYTNCKTLLLLIYGNDYVIIIKIYNILT